MSSELTPDIGGDTRTRTWQSGTWPQGPSGYGGT